MSGSDEPEYRGMLPPIDYGCEEYNRYPETDSMRDFWRISDRDSLPEIRGSGSQGGQTLGDFHHLEDQGRDYHPLEDQGRDYHPLEDQGRDYHPLEDEERALRPYDGFVAQLAETEPVDMEVQQYQHPVFFETPCQPLYQLESAAQPAPPPLLGTLQLSGSPYTNFYDSTTCTVTRQEMTPPPALAIPFPAAPSTYIDPFPSSVAPPFHNNSFSSFNSNNFNGSLNNNNFNSNFNSYFNNNFNSSFNSSFNSNINNVIDNISNYCANTGVPMMENETAIDREVQTFQRQLAYNCPQSSGLLVAITASAEAAVQQHESGYGSGHASDDDETLPQDPDSIGMRAAIVDHPLYPELVEAHVKIFTVGAPRGLRDKLEEITRKFQRLQRDSSRLGDDPGLDFFMKAYVDLLTRFGEDLEEPYLKFMQYKDSTSKALEDICGHYVETGPDEEDNYGYDVGTIYGTQESEDVEMLGDENGMYPTDIDDSIIIDPTASEDELKKMLTRKYGRHIAGLRAEFNRVRKKGKLPTNARQILKDWFNRHSFWPYPSEIEKAYLQRLCALNLKQINNWFINERKRHWNCEDKCMHPNTKFFPSSSSQGNGPFDMKEFHGWYLKNQSASADSFLRSPYR